MLTPTRQPQAVDTRDPPTLTYAILDGAEDLAIHCPRTYISAKRASSCWPCMRACRQTHNTAAVRDNCTGYIEKKECRRHRSLNFGSMNTSLPGSECRTAHLAALQALADLGCPTNARSAVCRAVVGAYDICSEAQARLLAHHFLLASGQGTVQGLTHH